MGSFEFENHVLDPLVTDAAKITRVSGIAVSLLSAEGVLVDGIKLAIETIKGTPLAYTAIELGECAGFVAVGALITAKCAHAVDSFVTKHHAH